MIYEKGAWVFHMLRTLMLDLQTLRKRNTEYMRFLDEYELDIRGNRGDAGPIWLGYRSA